MTTVGTGSEYYLWDAARLVQSWVDGSPNYGMALASTDESAVGFRAFVSREGAAAPPGPANAPRLDITYRPSIPPTPTLTPTPTRTPSSPCPLVSSSTSAGTTAGTALTVCLTPVADAYVLANGASSGTGDTLEVGNYGGAGPDSTLARALIRFDLSNIPAGATVLSASFAATLTQGPFSIFTPSPFTPLYVELKRADGTWDEAGVTWSTQPPYTGINSVTPVGIHPFDYFTWDATRPVQGWVDGSPNFGLALMSWFEGFPDWRSFISREGASSPSLRPSPPLLVITYQPYSQGGTPTPSATPTITPTFTPTATPTVSATPTATGTPATVS